MTCNWMTCAAVLGCAYAALQLIRSALRTVFLMNLKYNASNTQGTIAKHLTVAVWTTLVSPGIELSYPNHLDILTELSCACHMLPWLASIAGPKAECRCGTYVAAEALAHVRVMHNTVPYVDCHNGICCLVVIILLSV